MEMDDGPVEGFCGDATGAMYMNGFQSAFIDKARYRALHRRLHARHSRQIHSSHVRRRLRRRRGSARRRPDGHALRRASRFPPKLLRATGLQLALGRFLMLAAMTYAVELFISAIAGVAIGARPLPDRAGRPRRAARQACWCRGAARGVAPRRSGLA